MDSRIRPLDAPLLAADLRGSVQVGRLVWGFVVLGTLIRLVGYLLRFPLWVDECMLAENFLDRGYLDLLSPLDHDQVAPIGFLWIELACVRVFGFSEWSLRLLPLLCGIGSLFVFRHVASRLLAGIPLVVAVGCLAVAKSPVGLSANAKPYAGDLFVVVVLLALAVEWLRRPDRTIWLWGLAAALPAAFALSFPAVFVAGAVSLGLLVPVWRSGLRRNWCAFAAYHVSLGIAFTGLLWTCTLAKSPFTEAVMLDYWSLQDGFPPREAWHFLYWVTTIHIGEKIFAVPYGAENGGGFLGLVLCIVAAAAMYRRGQRPVLTMFLGIFGLTFLAALLQIYPYGGHNRLAQFFVPPVAISMGAGAGIVLSALRNPVVRRGLTTGLICGLGLFGAGVCCRDVLHPFHHVHDGHHREFARQFWRDEPATTTICALTDLGEDCCKPGLYIYYRCYQRIYSERHHLQQVLTDHEIRRSRRPLRLVVFRPSQSTLDPQALTTCLNRFEPYYEPAGHETYEPCQADSGFDKYGGYEVFRFNPREQAARREPVTERRDLSRK